MVSRSYNSDSERLKLLLSFSAFICFWGSKVLGEQNYYPEIHKIWPSASMPNIIISRATAEDEGDMNTNQTMVSPSSPRKTVVYPTPICVSLPMAPCVMFQIFWRNSSSSILGLKVPVQKIKSVPKPREKPMSKSHFFKLFSG